MPIFNNILAGAAGQTGGADAAAYEIERSLRFNSADSAYLNKDFSSAGNRKTWTWSGWVKLCKNKGQVLFHSYSAQSDTGAFFIDYLSTGELRVLGWSSVWRVTSALFRDFSAWQHVVVALDTTNDTANDMIKVYVNGSQITEFSTLNNPDEDDELAINQAAVHHIGNYTSGGGALHDYLDGYLADIHFIDGQALAASDFGEYDDNNVWQPKDASGLTFGTNGFHLDFSDNSSDAALGNDAAGSNDWTVYNLSADGPSVSTTGNISLSSTNRGFYFKGESGQSIGVSLGNHVWDSSNGISWTYRGTSGTSVSLTNTYVFISGTTNITFTNSSSASVRYWDTALNTGIANGVGDTTTFNIEDYNAENIDSLLDSPTNYEADSGNNGGNYCTMNPLHHLHAATLENGNLQTTSADVAFSTFLLKTGKWYVEHKIDSTGYNLCFSQIDHESGDTPSSTGSKSIGWYIPNGYVYWGAGYSGSLGGTTMTGLDSSGYMSNAAVGDVIAAAIDMDNSTIKFYKNGSEVGSIDFSTGTAHRFTEGMYISQFSGYGHWNFGARPFAYTPPEGYNPICAQYLDDPTIADGSTAFDTVLYSGDGQTTQTIALPFAPGLLWQKKRSHVSAHYLLDAVRGFANDKALASHDTEAEGVNSAFFTFSQSGSNITVGDYGTNTGNEWNTSGRTHVIWTWDAGSSTASNTDGSITTNVRANASAGFSICTYTSPDSSSNQSFGHGLNAKPDFVIVKNRDSPYNWDIYHSSLGYNSSLTFTTDDTRSGAFSAEPTSTVVNTKHDYTHVDTDDYIAYCWTAVEGYSAFGSWLSNNDDDGNFIYTGFRPRWVMVKAVDDVGDMDYASWLILDTERDPHNVADASLYANNNAEEGKRGDGSGSAGTYLDILSNGFKIRYSGTEVAGSDQNFLYAAFAEHSFKTARAR